MNRAAELSTCSDCSRFDVTLRILDVAALAIESEMKCLTFFSPPFDGLWEKTIDYFDKLLGTRNGARIQRLDAARARQAV